MPMQTQAHDYAWLAEAVVVLVLICAMSSGLVLAAWGLAAAPHHPMSCTLAWCESWPFYAR